MQPWKTLSRRTVLDCGTFLRVESHTVELPDGRVIPDWPWVITPDYVNVIVVTESGGFLFFRQTKYGVKGPTLAPVGGYLEPGEDPLETARREVLEETGYEAPEWISLGSFVVDGNRGAGTGHIYIARGARLVREPEADDLEEQQLVCLSHAEVETALDSGEFKLLSWAATVALALRRLDSPPPDRPGDVTT